MDVQLMRLVDYVNFILVDTLDTFVLLMLKLCPRLAEVSLGRLGSKACVFLIA